MLGMLGLGRIGGAMPRRLRRTRGIDGVGYHRQPQLSEVDDLAGRLDSSRRHASCG
jgi:lactate dehydrogenase-like 2-hydroxyacid dehydrogenase